MLSSFTNKLRSLIRKILKNRWVFRLIGIGVFILILTRIDLKEALSTLKGVNVWFVLLSIGIQGIALLVAMVRWQLIMRRLDIVIPLRRTFVHQMVGTATALVTPGQLGEFIKVLYHRKEGYPVADSFLSVAIDRAYDLLMLLFFGFISLAILVGLQPSLSIMLAVIAGLIFVVGFLFFRNTDKTANLIANILSRMSPKTYKDTVRKDAHRLTKKIGEFNIGFLVLIGLLTALNYILLLFRVYAVVLALHLSIPIGFFVLAVPILRLVGLVPISVLGIGTRDAASIYLFGQVGVPEASALLISILGLLTLQVQAIIGLIFWWLFPMNISTEKSPVLQESSLRK